MSGNDNLTCGKVEAPVTLLFTWIAKEDAARGSRRELMGGRGGDVWVAKTTKCPEVVIRGMDAVEKEMRGKMMNGARGADVEKRGGGV